MTGSDASLDDASELASAAASSSRLARKLEQFAPLSASERSALDRSLKARVQTIGPGIPLVEAGEAPSEILVVLAGWACSRRVSSNSRGQIVALHLPGDVCDFGALLKQHMDSSIVALTEMKIAGITRGALGELMREHPRVAQALWWEFMCASAIRGEWIARLGRRAARERVASLFCELAARLYVVGLADDDGFDLPLTQADLGNSCGMTPEHTNRTLRELREAGVASLENGRLKLIDWDELRRIGSFQADFLHFRDLRPSALNVPTPSAPSR